MLDPKEEIKNRLDVAEVIGDFVQLKPAGSGAMKGLCPFHTERTPSFHVSRERQIWKCFGCDKGGDIFTFLMEIEGLTFPEALEALAQKAGVTLPARTSQQAGVKDAREEMLAVQEAAAKFYAAVLLNSEAGARGRTYVHGRNIPKELQEKFRLGVAPDAWSALSEALLGKGFSAKAIIEAGLAFRKKSGDGLVDRFRHRLMIPLCDPQGRVVGFTARALPGSPADAAKYMNSPETLTYKKGAMLYGLHLAKAAARKHEEMILVEGNLDVVSSHKVGVENVVAVSGTALTPEQLRLLARYVPQIAFALDDDQAGFAAAKRAVELALELQKTSEVNLRIRAVRVPGHLGKDPDEVIQKDPAAWPLAASKSIPVLEYLVDRTIDDYERSGRVGIDDKLSVLDSLLPTIARMGRPDERDYYVGRLADATGLEKVAVQERFRQLVQGQARDASKPGPAAPTVKGPSPKIARSGTDKAIDQLIAVMLKEEAYTPIILAGLPAEFLTDLQKALVRVIQDLYTDSDQSPTALQQKSFFARLRTKLETLGDPQLIAYADTLIVKADELMVGLTSADLRRDVEIQLTRLVTAEGAVRKAELAAQIREAERKGDRAALQNLLAQYHTLLG
jgi:DNA primase